MSNLLKTIEDELSRLRRRVTELEIAHVVITDLMLKAPPVQATPALTHHKKKSTRRGHVIKIAKRMVLDILAKRGGPVRGMEFVDMITADGKIGESTVWKALKDSRDGGLINWDTETRLYTAAVQHNEEKIAS